MTSASVLCQNRIEREWERIDVPFGEIDPVSRAVRVEKTRSRTDSQKAHVFVRFIVVLEVPRLEGFDQEASDSRVFGFQRMPDIVCLSAEGVHFPAAQGHVWIVFDFCHFPRLAVGHDVKTLSIKEGIDHPGRRDVVLRGGQGKLVIPAEEMLHYADGGFKV